MTMNNGTKKGSRSKGNESSNIPVSKQSSIEKMLWSLHRELCVYFVSLLNDKENPPKSTTLDIVRQFLRDNKISIEHSNRVSGAGLGGIVNDLESWASSLDPEDVLEQRDEKKKGREGGEGPRSCGDDEDIIPEIKIFQ